MYCKVAFKSIIPAAIAILGFSSPVFAEQPQALCGVTDVAALDAFAVQLEGQWETIFHPGYVVAGPLVMPHAAAPSPETGRFEIRGGRLTLIPNSSDGIDVSFDWETGVDWSFDNQPSIPGIGPGKVPDLMINDHDLGIVAECDVNDMPRLVGAESIPIQGGQMTFVLRLMVVNSDIIYGFQQVHGIVRGQSVLERRAFTMTK